MRGLDHWISRGHERLDDEPEPLHPDEASLLAEVDAQIERELEQAKAYAAITDAFFRKLWGVK